MKKDILLVNPPITLEERYGSFASVGSQAPPLGLCYLAAASRKQGYTVQIIDAPTLGLDLDQTTKEIIKSNARLIGLTASTVSIYRASELAKALKRAEVKAPLLIGGPHVSSLPAETLKELQNAPPDEFGVTHHDILFSEEEDRIYCVLDAPNREAIEMHHAKAGIKCEHIHEVESTRG